MELKFLGTNMYQVWEMDLIVGKIYKKIDYYIIDEKGEKFRLNDYRLEYFEVIK